MSLRFFVLFLFIVFVDASCRGYPICQDTCDGDKRLLLVLLDQSASSRLSSNYPLLRTSLQDLSFGLRDTDIMIAGFDGDRELHEHSSGEFLSSSELEPHIQALVFNTRDSSSNVYGGFIKAVERIAREHENVNALRTVLVISDGKDWAGRASIKDVRGAMDAHAGHQYLYLKVPSNYTDHEGFGNIAGRDGREVLDVYTGHDMSVAISSLVSLINRCADTGMVFCEMCSNKHLLHDYLVFTILGSVFALQLLLVCVCCLFSSIKRV